MDAGGAVLSLTTTGRLATPAQLRALAVRDGGCVIPGCSRPPAWCDAHHVVWWSRGGKTVLENLVLLCTSDHTAVHTGLWRVVMVDGLPHVIAPPWLDPQQRPRRNTLLTGRATAHTNGQRLARSQLLLADDAAAPPPLPERRDGRHRDRSSGDGRASDPPGG